jgi:hypothetical protein
LAFRFGEVALRAPPNGNRQRRLSSCSPQCPSYPLPGDYDYIIIIIINELMPPVACSTSKQQTNETRKGMPTQLERL